MQNASKVGFLLVLFVALFAGAYQVLGQKLFAKPPMIIKAEFADAGGINPGNKVLMAGVKIGSVQSISLESPTKAVMTLAIDDGVRIPKGSRALLPTSLIGFGDNPIQIIPQGASTEMLTAGEMIPGVRGGALDAIAPELGPSLQQTLAELNKTMAAARGLIEDNGIRDELTGVLAQTSETLKGFNALANQAAGTISENRSSIQSTLTTFALAMKDVQKSTKLAAELLADPKYKDQAAEILANLNATTKKADELMANVNAIVGDPNLKQNLDATMSNVSTITDSGTRIASNTEKITTNGVTISENVVELTKKANELADQAKSVFEKLQRFFERPGNNNPLKGLETTAELERDFDGGRFQSNFNAKVPISGGNVHVGIWDAFETNKINAQIGKPFGKSNEYRYGMYAGKPGLGVEFSVAPKTRLRGDLYGLNDPRLDIRAQYDFRNDILGWIGFNRVGERNNITAGIGIRK